jgi:hypothetical protein
MKLLVCLSATPPCAIRPSKSEGRNSCAMKSASFGHPQHLNAVRAVRNGESVQEVSKQTFSGPREIPLYHGAGRRAFLLPSSSFGDETERELNRSTMRRPKGKSVIITSVAGPSVSQVVHVKGGYELRVYTTYTSAVAAGLNRQIAGHIFHKVDKKLCEGVCVLNSHWLYGFWCSDSNCENMRCECRLYKMWKDKEGKWHDEDMGKHGKKKKLQSSRRAFYRCSCVQVIKPAKKTRYTRARA